MLQSFFLNILSHILKLLNTDRFKVFDIFYAYAVKRREIFRYLRKTYSNHEHQYTINSSQLPKIPKKHSLMFRGFKKEFTFKI